MLESWIEIFNFLILFVLFRITDSYKWMMKFMKAMPLAVQHINQASRYCRTLYTLTLNYTIDSFWSQ